MQKAVENKKNLKTPKDHLGHQIWFKTKEKGARLTCVDFKNRSIGQGNEDQSEPSHRFSSNLHEYETREPPRRWS